MKKKKRVSATRWKAHQEALLRKRLREAEHDYMWKKLQRKLRDLGRLDRLGEHVEIEHRQRMDEIKVLRDREMESYREKLAEIKVRRRDVKKGKHEFEI